MKVVYWRVLNICTEMHCILIKKIASIFQSSGARFSKVPGTFRARKASRKTMTCLFCKACLFICCKGNKNKNNCKVSCLETPSFWRYKENCVTRNTPEKPLTLLKTGWNPCRLERNSDFACMNLSFRSVHYSASVRCTGPQMKREAQCVGH